ncbi:MAG: hypothetical protein LBS74_01265 [Oscillospiraceae bacterium]|nr:hypothetical protein [Oscillospiraceae bacterium]
MEFLLSLAPVVLVILGVLVVIALILFLKGFYTVQQNTIVVITLFGKYLRCVKAGLHWKFPWEKIYSRCSLKMQSVQLEFQAITIDQANIRFKTLIIYSVLDNRPETVKQAVFRFENKDIFLRTLFGLTEGELRTEVAKFRQQQVLGIREELSQEVVNRVNKQLAEWGYRIADLQVTDISFDRAVTDSMTRVVAAQNEMQAANNEGEAVRIKLTKEAEAQGAALRIRAEAEKTAAKLRGEGLAEFRQAITRGISGSIEEIERAGGDINTLIQYLYLETLKDVAKDGKGKIIFMDNGAGAAQRMVNQISALSPASGYGNIDTEENIPEVEENELAPLLN